MTTKVTIEAEIHSQEKRVQVQVLENGVAQETIYLKPGQKTEQYVYGDRMLGIAEVDAAVDTVDTAATNQ